RVSRYGLVAYGSSLDQVGVLAKDVRDSALVLSAMAGHDAYDSTSMPAPVPDFTAALTGDVRGLRIGLPDEYFIAGVQPDVEAAVRRAIDVLGEMGAEIVRVSLP
ncbi:MAG: Asp-tRNA(Asn)/Glu-tRNA(Gln) amidotransferase GatCAB subunit A, partial [Caldilineaceae bacterium]|nr:Asp-tRNA(Asn)/Glu-tRNA(Gln) amidotransferase GatCAB subunit A [Caldilineaceae bacterium]